MTTTAPSSNDPRTAPAAQSTQQFAAAAHDGINRAAEAVHPAVDRLSQSAHGAVDRVADVAATTANKVAAKTGQARVMQDQLLDDCRLYVRDNPLKALGFAVAAGFILSRILRD